MIVVVWVEEQKGPVAITATGPLHSVVLFLVSLVILEVVLAVSTPPKTPMKVVEILAYDVEVGPIDDFLSCGDFTAVRADKLHFRSNTPA